MRHWITILFSLFISLCSTVTWACSQHHAHKKVHRASKTAQKSHHPRKTTKKVASHKKKHKQTVAHARQRPRNLPLKYVRMSKTPEMDVSTEVAASSREPSNLDGIPSPQITSPTDNSSNDLELQF